MSEHTEAADQLNLGQVMADLRKGEKTADVLESNLSNLEKKIDALLASVGEPEIATGEKKEPGGEVEQKGQPSRAANQNS
ncbi:hypothetical protein BJ878DRAFT_538252 [Calycina marina]|uniref:Uncharacterized protein n=1 Tax=Calycina marina TaxID=1763456 RepID=A0A9P8CIQ2_9HELO|nr:hypothetical protein BJ878DRAFT_538252 [Calycina marina]